MNASTNLRIEKIEYRGYQAVKVFPVSGFWPKGGAQKEEVRTLVQSANFILDSAEPYLLNANEYFENLKPLESVVAFVFFLSN